MTKKEYLATRAKIMATFERARRISDDALEAEVALYERARKQPWWKELPGGTSCSERSSKLCS